jgi:hypothetical protein
VSCFKTKTQVSEQLNYDKKLRTKLEMQANAKYGLARGEKRSYRPASIAKRLMGPAARSAQPLENSRAWGHPAIAASSWSHVPSLARVQRSWGLVVWKVKLRRVGNVQSRQCVEKKKDWRLETGLRWPWHRVVSRSNNIGWIEMGPE